MKKLLNDIQKFIEEAYTQMVIIKGYKPKEITLFVDRQAGQAVIQYSFFNYNINDYSYYETDPSLEIMREFEKPYLLKEEQLMSKNKPSTMPDVYVF